MTCRVQLEPLRRMAQGACRRARGRRWQEVRDRAQGGDVEIVSPIQRLRMRQVPLIFAFEVQIENFMNIWSGTERIPTEYQIDYLLPCIFQICYPFVEQLSLISS